MTNTITKLPFLYYREATDPIELARAIASGAFSQTEAARHLENGGIKYWVAHFDERKSRCIEHRMLEEKVMKNPQAALRELVWILNPMAPLVIE